MPRNDSRAGKGVEPAPVDVATEYDIVFIPLGAAALGGAERSLLELAGTLRNAGLQPMILCGSALLGTGFEALVEQQGVHLQWTDWDPTRGWTRNLLSAIAVFRNLRCSVIHFNTSWRAGMWTVPVAARLVSRARLVGTMRAMPDPFKSGNRRHFGFLPGLGLWKVAARLVGRTWARTLHITVSVNANDYPQRLVRDFGFDPRKLRVIRNGIRAPQTLTETQRPTEAVEGRSSQRLAGPTRICLLYVGRISPEKGIDHLVRAVAELPEHYSLTIVGDGPSLLQIQSLTEELHVTARVEFVGFVHDPYPQIIASDIVVVPSIWEEAFGRVVIEAMFLMKPVVATRVGGMAEIFVDRLEGVYIPPKDVYALKTAIEELGQDVSLRRRIGERARRRALKDYSMSRVAAEYVDTYVSLLKHSRIPARFAAAAIRLSEESTPPFPSPNGRSMDG